MGSPIEKYQQVDISTKHVLISLKNNLSYVLYVFWLSDFFINSNFFKIINCSSVSSCWVMAHFYFKNPVLWNTKLAYRNSEWFVCLRVLGTGSAVLAVCGWEEKSRIWSVEKIYPRFILFTQFSPRGLPSTLIRSGHQFLNWCPFLRSWL